MYLYGIKIDDNWMGIVYGNEEYFLRKFSGINRWLVDSAEHAEWVRTNSSPLYLNGYDTPTNPYVGQGAVFELECVESRVKDIKLPTFKEVMVTLDERYNDDVHASFVDNPQVEQGYSLYDLRAYIRHMKGKQK